jgi:hypothetical protein
MHPSPFSHICFLRSDFLTGTYPLPSEHGIAVTIAISFCQCTLATNPFAPLLRDDVFDFTRNCKGIPMMRECTGGSACMFLYGVSMGTIHGMKYRYDVCDIFKLFRLYTRSTSRPTPFHHQIYLRMPPSWWVN